MVTGVIVTTKPFRLGLRLWLVTANVKTFCVFCCCNDLVKSDTGQSCASGLDQDHWHFGFAPSLRVKST